MVKVVSNLIEERRILELSEYFQKLNSVDIARDMIYLRDEEAVLAFRILPKDMAVEVFSYLDKEMKQNIIQLITDNEIKDITDKLKIYGDVDVFHRGVYNIKCIVRGESGIKSIRNMNVVVE